MKRICLVLGALVFLCFLSAPTARAWDNFPDWLKGEPVVRMGKGAVSRDEADASMIGCTPQLIRVRDYAPQSVCVTEMKGWRYALYEHYSTDWRGIVTAERYFVVGIGTDSQMYRVEGLPGVLPPLSNPGSETLTYRFDNGMVPVYRHFLNHLEKAGDGYRIKDAPDTLELKGSMLTARTAAISRGGDWLVAETPQGIARISLATLEVRLIDPLVVAYDALDTSRMELAISDDGQTVVVGGRMYQGRQFKIITVTDGCGADQATSCGTRNLESLFTTDSLPDGWPVDLRLSPHGTRLDLYVEQGDQYSGASLYPYGSVPQTLRYLALGDSFSSGEGDGDRSYYLPHTNDSAHLDVCHTSSRSYPYLLAAHGGLNAFETPVGYGVRSVACSGARIGDIDGSDGYDGQQYRLSDTSTATLETARTAAMNDFIPGRVRQLDFVNEYQPEALSLGVGGNDVQFSAILAMCVRSVFTCDYASDPIDKRNLGESIARLYPKLTSLYTRLARADPDSRIYAIGYPLFMNDSRVFCPLTTNLDYAERTMINEGVRYMNAVTKAAAASAGVGYIDIADALVGYRACDDPGGYVNTIDLIEAAHGKVDLGTFHPNELGHSAIATRIEQVIGSDLAAHEYCLSNRYPCPVATHPPDLPTFFGDASVRPHYLAIPSELVRVSVTMIPDIIINGAKFVIQTTGLMAGSEARIELHSEPVELGVARVGGDGTVTAEYSMPVSVTPGYHTLHLYGESPSGEAVDQFQIVYVDGDSPGALPASTSNSSAPSPPLQSKAVTNNVVTNTTELPPLLPYTGDYYAIWLTMLVLLQWSLLLPFIAHAMWHRGGSRSRIKVWEQSRSSLKSPEEFYRRRRLNLSKKGTAPVVVKRRHLGMVTRQKT